MTFTPCMPQKNVAFIPCCFFICLIFLSIICSADNVLAETEVSGNISSDTTWTVSGSPYVVTGEIEVYGSSSSNCATLTIEPGVEVRFRSAGALAIGKYDNINYWAGALVAHGTAESPIIFTSDSTTPAPGDWGGLLFSNQDNATTILEHCIIEYGGGNYTLSSYSNVKVDRCSPTLVNCTIRNAYQAGLKFDGGTPEIRECTIADNGSYGVFGSYGSSALIESCDILRNGLDGIYWDIYSHPILSNNNISDNANFAISVDRNVIIESIAGNSGSGNNNGDALEIRGGNLYNSQLWKNRVGLPYVVTGEIEVYGSSSSNCATLTIEPGVEVRFRSAGALIIGHNDNINYWAGALIAQGTTDSPIIFTSDSATPSPGDWNGLVFNNPTDATTILKYCTIEYGGGSYATGRSSNVYINQTSPTLINCTIRHSLAHGINGDGSSCRIEGCDINENGQDGINWEYDSHPAISSNKISDNGGYGLYNNSSTVIDARFNHWGSVTGPYHPEGNPNGQGDRVSDNVLYEPWTSWENCELKDTSDLSLNQQSFGRLEESNTRDQWTFSAVANQQVSLDVISNPDKSIYFDLVGPNDWVGFSAITDDSELYTLPETGVYTIIVYKVIESTDLLYSFKLKETAQTDLTLEVPYNGTFPGDNYSHLFKIEINDGKPLIVYLDDASNLNVSELYIKFGTPPTRGDFDCKSTPSSGSDKKIIIPIATDGTWYVLLNGENIVENSNYSIVATQSSVIVSSITPEKLGNNADSIITVTGSGFNSETQVFLVGKDGTQYPASIIEVDSFNQLTVTFTQGSLPVGVYSILVTHPNGDSDSLGDAFEMVQGGTAKLETRIIVPSKIGHHVTATIYAEYSNTGDAAMPAPLMVVTSVQDGRKHAMLKLGDTVPARGFWTSAMPEGFSNTVQFLASGHTPGVIQPGESMRIPIQYAGMQKPWSSSIITFTLSVLDADNSELVDWNSHKVEMKPEGMTDEAWEPVWSNFRLKVGNTWGDYVQVLSGNAEYLGHLGHNVTDIAKLLAFELEQCNALNPVQNLSDSTDAYVEAVGIDIVFNRFYHQRLSSRYLSSSFGFGWSHNWDIHCEVESDGTVNIIGPAEKRRTFQPDIRPGYGYFAMEGDYGTLTNLGSGIFSLKEANGLIRMYRSDGKLDYIEDTNGNRITAEYTGDMLTSLEHSSGRTLQIVYNIDDRIETVEDPDGRRTTYEYDASGEHLSLVTYFDNSSVRYEYFTNAGDAKDHALSEVEYIDGYHQYFTYDNEGRLNRTYLEGGTEEYTFSYNDTGMVSIADSFGNTHKVYFDHNSMVAKHTDPKENITTLKYDNNYNLLESVNPTGHSQNYGYDKAGNLISIKNQIGFINLFENKGPYHELSKINDSKDNIVDYGYDTAGNLTSITYNSGDVENWAYDTDGTVSSWTNCRSGEVSYTHDATGRLTEINYPDDSQVTYDYDARGNLISATNENGEITLQYYPDDRLQQITYPDGKYLQYTYNSAGLRTSVTDQLGHVQNYSYNNSGKLEFITDENAVEFVHYEYDIGGRLTKSTMANGMYTVYSYDAAKQITALINYAPDDSELSKYIYTYDSRGRRTSMITLDGTWAYKYDGSGQLTECTSPYGHTVSYEYDAVGNRISVTDNGTTENYTTNDLNQYSQVGDVSYVYDADGNMISRTDTDGTTTYGYDIHSRLIQVVTPTDGTWDYTYDALGNRNSVSHDGNVTSYVNDPFGMVNVAAEYDDSGVLVKRYVHGLGLAAQIDGAGNQAFYAFDGNGNTGQLTDDDGAVLNSYVYSPFGVILQEGESVSNSFKFVGQFGVMDAGNGLSFMRARYYAGDIGRFVAKDPIGINAGDVNFYRYCGNDGVNFVDLCGEKKKKDFLTAWRQRSDFRDRPGDDGDGFDAIGRVSQGNDDVAETAPEFSGKIGQSALLGIQPAPHPLVDLGLSIQTVLELFLTKIKPKEDPIPHTEPGPDGDRIPAGAYDPNEKIGPAGYGAAGYISGDTMMPYRVNFENESEATAPAQIVFVTDQLDEDLDWSTFELTEVGFGDVRIPIPQGSKYFETTVPFSCNGVDFEVQIQAGITLSTGEAYVYFYSLDPATSMPPAVDTGFLPQEDGTGRGQGFFSYIIKPKKGLPNGTEIRNVAIIQFDFQATIATNQIDPHDPSQGTDPNLECLNTIYTGAPFPTSALAIPDGTTDVPVSTILTWSYAAFTNSYELYLWELGQTPPTTPTATGLETLSWDASSVLAEDATYYWRIDSINDSGVTTGTVWSFSTVASQVVPLLSYVSIDGECSGFLPCYDTVAAAYQDADDGQKIKVSTGFYLGDLLLEYPIEVTLSGGWNDGYSDNSEGQTTIGGSLIITGGTVITDGIIIEGTDSLARTNRLQFGCWLPEYWSKWASLN